MLPGISRWTRTPQGGLLAAAAALALFAGTPDLVRAQSAGTDMEAAAASLDFREIGPTIMGGRVADLAVVESDPSTFYVGAASGGVWKTTNGGTTFTPVFESYSTASIGDVTVAPSNPNVVWVGTGEPNNRQSSPWGDGVYKSLDGGRTWHHMGLEATHHIGRIQIDPTDPNTVYVAAVGHLWGSNPERGVYKTTDGGESWERVLFVDDMTGAIDLAMDPGDPNTLFAAMYQRQRKAWGFNGGGPGSGIYRTFDGGETWEELTNGLPEGDKGRIGLDIYKRDGNIVYAIVEADKRSPGQGFGGGNDRDAKNGVYRSLDRGETWEHMSTHNNRPMYYSQIRVDPNDPDRVYTGGRDFSKSVDGGRNFDGDAGEGVHLDHHAFWIDPADSDHIILAGDGGVSISWDQAAEWRQLRNLPISQFYEIGADFRTPYHVCGGLQDNGSWCAPHDTWSNQGIRTRDWYNVSGGDGFFTVMHPGDTTIMFSESQGGNLQRVNLMTRESVRMRPVARPTEEDEDRELRWNWDTPVVLSAHDPNTVYIGSNVLFRSTDLGQSWQEISGDLTHAIDRNELEIMGVKGSEPQHSRNDGQGSYGNLTAIAESPLNPDVLYTGADDGRVHATRDGGATWSDISDNFPELPERTYVTRLVASHGAEGTVYAAFDGHRNDDFQAYVYRSDDFGREWERITDGLPASSVNALEQHPRTANLLFVGNELGAWFSVDEGDSWAELTSLPTVPVDDIVVHPRENDLILGTHGRGVWVMSDVGPLEEMSREVLAADAHLFDVRTALSYNPYTPQGWTPGVYVAPNPPQGAIIRYYLGSDLQAEEQIADEGENGGSAGGSGGAGAGENGRRGMKGGDAAAKAKISILDASGEVIRTMDAPGKAGLQEVVWDLRIEPPYEPDNGGGGGFFGAPRGVKVLPGDYTVRLEAAGETHEEPVTVELDPRITISQADLMARQEAMMDAYHLAKPIYEANQALQRLTRQVREIQGLVRGHEDAPESLGEEVKALNEELQEIRSEMGDLRGAQFAAFGLERSTTRPTDDQLWEIEQAWNELPALVERINVVITETLPAINRQLDEHGVRPDPGDALEVPSKGGM